MKKLITLILAVVMIMGILPTTAVHAVTMSDSYDIRLKEHKRLLELEATDEYTLDYWSLDLDHYQSAGKLTGSLGEQYAIVKEITAGITDEYEKAKAIYTWLSKNMVYVARGDTSGVMDKWIKDLPSWQYGVCEDFARATYNFYRLAGFPSKTIHGYANGLGSGGHAWNHVYIDGRWVYVDTTFEEFDDPVEYWTGGHAISDVRFTEAKWDGKMTIVDTSTGQEVQTIGPIPLNTPLGDIPELNLTNLFIDAEGKYPVRAKDKFRITHKTLYTKTHRVAFNIQLDNQYKSIVSHVVDETNGNLNSFVSVPSGADFPQVKLPTKAGYTFIGWRDLYNEKAPLWNAGSGKVTEDMAMIAVFKKGTVNYTVKYNANGGTAVKDATVKANTTLKQPTVPTKANYKFTGWYKDSALTQPWNFAYPVTSNLTLYAGWESTNNAKPTASKVLVNGKAVEFDAYTINNNNYFKLRDLAQAVNKTDKNFEVTWDGKNNAINLISNKVYTPAGGELVKGDGKAKAATLSTAKIFKDGKEVSLTAYTINGNNYFKLRDIAKAFDIGVTWDGTTNTVGIDTSISYVE